MDTKRLKLSCKNSHQCVVAALAFVVIGPSSHDPEAAGDPDLTVQIQQVTANPVVTGAHPITYPVTINNIGNSLASAVVTVVTFPNSFTFQTPAASGSGFTCGPPAIATGLRSVTCTTNQVGANEKKGFTVQAVAPTAIAGSSQAFTITATVDPNNTVAEENEGNNTGRVTTTVVPAPADLTVQIQQVTANPVRTGAHPIFYKVTVRNLEDYSTPLVVTVVTFPNAWTFETPAASGSDFACGNPVSAGTGLVSVSCTTSQVGGNAQKEFTVKAKAPTTIVHPIEQLFTITATVDPNNAVDEGNNEGNNTGTVTTNVQTQGDLTASVSGSAITATVGSNITYVMTVKNIGDRAVANARVLAILPQQVEFVRRDGGAFQSCERLTSGSAGYVTSFGAGDEIRCVGDLLPGAETSANIIAKVPSLVPDGTRMPYYVRADPYDQSTERSELNNSAAAITTVSAPADLFITGSQTHGCGFFGIGSSCRFTLRLVVHNAGPGQSGTTILRVTLPPGYVDDFPLAPIEAGEACSVNCTLGSIVPGANSNELWISATGPGNMSGTIIIVPVVVDPNHTVLETNENNNGLTFTFTQ